MLNEEAISRYLLERFPEASGVEVRKLGAGVHGAGFLARIRVGDRKTDYVAKVLNPEGLGHDYPADRASVFLLDLDEFGNLPRHVKALDVIAEMPDGTVRSIGGGKEYYLLMERAYGSDYFNDLKAMKDKDGLSQLDISRIKAMASYLAEIHSLRKDSKSLYLRKLRDSVGHGECLMGVLDIYPEGVLQADRAAWIVKKSVDYIYRLRDKHHRLRRIHGDFHPGNIWFTGEGADFILLDRSRGPWGDPADDVTALSINYIFFSVMNHGELRGAYREGFRLFFKEYLDFTGDREMLGALAPFYAFRGVVVANPVFYPMLTDDRREIIISFVENVLEDSGFDYEDPARYFTARH